jgi:hypothetical protein
MLCHSSSRSERCPTQKLRKVVELALVAFICEVLGGLGPLLQVIQIAEYRLRGHNSVLVILIWRRLASTSCQLDRECPALWLMR